LTQFAELLVSEFAESSDFWGTAMSASLLDAIVDSGASFTFVTDKVQLSNPMPGKGKVWVANGQSEDIAEMGRLGPLMARKVKSFDRTLISVRDLVDKYGGVYFDDEGVHLITNLGEDLVCSTIGAANDQRLYGFDLTGLQEHHDKVSKLIAASSDTSCCKGGALEVDATGLHGALNEHARVFASNTCQTGNTLG
jgi:hypothetical protein